jgi:hypothetical protein
LVFQYLLKLLEVEERNACGRKQADFESQMDRAISEAIAALEMVLFYRKICGFLRHIEIRYGDSHGNVFI